MFNRKNIPEVRKAPSISTEIPPLAKDVVERTRILNSPDVPDELPSIKDISEQKIKEQNSEEDELLSPALKNESLNETHLLKERMERIEAMLKSAGPGKFLSLRDGKVLHNISDLRTALVSMSSETFNYHVNFERNDFAAWILNVFGDKTLSEKVDSSTSKAQLIRVLNEHFD